MHPPTAARDCPITILLSRREKETLIEAARKADRPIGSMARVLISKGLATVEPNEAHDAPRDGAH